MPLWRSLLLNLADRISPERFPPLELTSRPIDTGMLFGDRLALPWYRTVFSNISDVVSPDMAAPLELTARPIPIDDWISDNLSRSWWSMLAESVRDRLSPERPAPLDLTSKPIAAYGARSWLQIMDWSSLLSTPKIFLPDTKAEPSTAIPDELLPTAPPAAAPAVPLTQDLWAAQMQFKRDLSRSRFRQKVWISLVAAEAIFLLANLFNFKF